MVKWSLSGTYYAIGMDRVVEVYLTEVRRPPSGPDSIATHRN